MRDQVRESRRVTALVIRDMATRDPIRIMVGGKPFPVPDLLGDPQVIGALLKIGLFSIGAQSFSDMRLDGFGGRTQAEPMENVPAALIGMAFSYALKSTKDETDKVELRKRARRIEKVFGPVPLDPILMSEIAALATKEA